MLKLYNPKSDKASEFISHEEIEETLKFAEENKTNVELIDSIIEKAKIMKQQFREISKKFLT